MFLIEGIAGVAGSIVYGLMTAIAWSRAGYDPTHLDVHACSWFVASLVTGLFGFYLATDGQRVVELVFLPPRVRDP